MLMYLFIKSELKEFHAILQCDSLVTLYFLEQKTQYYTVYYNVVIRQVKAIEQFDHVTKLQSDSGRGFGHGRTRLSCVVRL